MSVVLGLYLDRLGYDPPTIGLIFTVALLGGALTTVVVTTFADRLGRRRMLVIGGFLMAAAGLAFALPASLPILLATVAVGAMSPSGKEVGPFLPLEQAILPQTTSELRRTDVFAWYNLVGSLAGAFGALAAGWPAVMLRATDEAPLWTFQADALAYAGLAVVVALLFTRLGSSVEPVPTGPGQNRGLHRSRGVVFRLSALFGLDALAGGFVIQSIVAYWFHQRYQVPLDGLAALFFATNLMSAISFLFAARIASRVGLLNTMVFTHLPSNVLLALVPIVPGLPLAMACLVLRHLLSQMDVPTRQSYVIAIVDPSERTAAAGWTGMVRNLAAAVAPVFAGFALQNLALGVPFLLGGGLKIVYDLTLLLTFRKVKPPEEIKAGAGRR